MERKLHQIIQKSKTLQNQFMLTEKSREDSLNLRSPAESKNPIPPSPNIVLFRSILNDLPHIFIALIVGCVATWLALLPRDLNRLFYGLDLARIFTVILAIGFTIMCIVVAFRRFNVRYIIADDGIKALRGIISNNQVDAKLEYYQIRGTEIHRSLFERLVGTGDLHVFGSTSNVTEVAFKGIFDPYRYQKVIQERHRLELDVISQMQSRLT